MNMCVPRTGIAGIGQESESALSVGGYSSAIMSTVEKYSQFNGHF